MLERNKKIIFAVLAVLVFSAFSLIADAQPTIPPQPGGPSQGNFLGYVSILYPFMLSVAVILAVVMLVISGLQMMAAVGNPGMIESAKKKIWGAIGGLLLAVLSFLILRTINPQLVNFQLNFPVVNIGSNTSNNPGNNNKGIGQSCSNSLECASGLWCPPPVSNPNPAYASTIGKCTPLP